MELENLSTGVILLSKSQSQIIEINTAAKKILGIDLGGMKAIEKLLASLEELEGLKRSEIKINGQHYNLYLQELGDHYLVELSQIIYQDMKQSTHELKRPIQNIKTLVETLIMGAKDDATRLDDYLSKLNHEADRLGTMVQDMLSLSHVLSGTVELNIVEIDFNEMLDKLLGLAQSRASARSINLSADLPAGTKIQADKKYFEHMLANLIDNAIKYNKDSGQVSVTYKEGVLSVADTGMGIPAQDLEKIFDQFYRVQASADIQGTGLGLAMVRAIADLHGWGLEIESELGQGTKFSVKI